MSSKSPNQVIVVPGLLLGLLLTVTLAFTGPVLAEENSTTTTTTAGTTSTTVPDLATLTPETAPISFLLRNEGDPPSVNSIYVNAAYEALLRRPADPGGAAFWLDSVVAGGDRSREKMAAALLFSVEGASNEVVRAYRDLLNRFPEEEGWNYWTGILQHQRVDALRILIMSSDEYLLTHGGQSHYVENLYLELLGRPPEPEGTAYWTNKLEQGEPRQNVVGAIYLSDEGLGNRVSAYYWEFLGRPATIQERETGVEVIRATGERRLFAKVFATDEFFDQFFDTVFDG